MSGGDTDTNAKIIGNLFGSFYEHYIPQSILDVVFHFDCTRIDDINFKRPFLYGIQNAISILKKTIQHIELKIKNEKEYA